MRKEAGDQYILALLVEEGCHPAYGLRESLLSQASERR